jgi:hypothetical protein
VTALCETVGADGRKLLLDHDLRYWEAEKEEISTGVPTVVKRIAISILLSRTYDACVRFKDAFPALGLKRKVEGGQFCCVRCPEQAFACQYNHADGGRLFPGPRSLPIR